LPSIHLDKNLILIDTAYVVNQASKSVSVIDTQNNTVSENIPVGEGALRIAYNPNNGNMYVTNVIDNTISVIETVPSKATVK
jgi:YVTN family beta-propeller protein